MFREMRRKDRQLTVEEANSIIKSQNWGVLCVHGDDGYPYGIPVNYGFVDGKLYIHCTANESHKLDAIRRDDKVCFTVVGEHEMQAELLTTIYSSAMVFGRAHIITESAPVREAMLRMMSGLAPEMLDKAEAHCKHSMDAMAMIEIVPEHITGKQRKA